MPNATIIPALNPIQPGAYSTVNLAAAQSVGSTGTAIPAIVGVAYGGAPNTPLYFRGQQALRSVLRSGDAYDVARHALSQVRGTPVCVVRVGNSIAASTKSLTGASGNPVVLTSRDFGTWCNSISVQVQANNKIVVDFTDEVGVVYTEVFDGGASATAADMVACVNGKVAGVAGSRFVSAATGSGTMPLTVAARATMTGGTDGTAPAGGDWTNGLAALETEPVSIVVPATGDATVHAQVKTHCDAMSVPLARKERTCVIGGVGGETVAQVISRVTTPVIGSRVELVYPGFTGLDASGAAKTYAPYVLAGLVAGAWCANPDAATSLVHRDLPLLDVERKLSSVQGGDIDSLLAAGVTPVESSPTGGFRIVDSVSTYRAPDGLFRDYHVQRSLDAAQQRFRSELEPFVGSKNLNGSAASMTTVVNRAAEWLKGAEIIRDYQPSTATELPAGNGYSVGIQVMPVGVNKFLFLTMAVQPPSSTA